MCRRFLAVVNGSSTVQIRSSGVQIESSGVRAKLMLVIPSEVEESLAVP
jgi:hypothetical protein